MPAPRYVVDACVAFKWYVPEPQADLAIQIGKQARAGEIRLVAPLFLQLEVLNVAWKHTRQGLLEPERVDQIAAALPHAPVEWVREERLLRAAAELAVRLDCTVYDALYLALAAAYDAVLVTADSRLCQKVPEDEQTKRVKLLGEFAA
jgi:predicted nucleic acid-binding protein